MPGELESYFGVLGAAGPTIQASAGGRELSLEEAMTWSVAECERVKREDRRVFFIGNGGSAGIASHMAIDWTKNGGFNALAFNDGAYLTCLANDLGYDQVFALPLTRHARRGDLIFAISSSGRSPNILAAVEAARARDARVVTLSGFGADNPLREAGDLNFYVPIDLYGFVEIAHLTICHAILDIAMGWSASGRRPVYVTN